MNVLVTGAGGFLGKELIKKLSDQPDIKVFVILREGSDTSYLPDKGITIIQDDLVSPKNIKKMLKDGIDVVYHLASATSGTHTDLILNTVVGTDNLLSCLEGINVKRFVLVSSFSVYGLTHTAEGSVVNEKTPIEDNMYLRDSYTISKLKQEHLTIKRCQEMKLPLVIVRPGKIYGPGSFPIPPQLGLNIPGLVYLYIGGGGQIPFTHVTNCADAIYLAGVAEGIDGEIFNIVDDDLPTQKEFLRIYKKDFDPSFRTIWIPFRLFKLLAILFEYGHTYTKGNIPPIISRYRADNFWKPQFFENAKAKQKLNWHPEVSIQKGLKEMFESLKNIS